MIKYMGEPTIEERIKSFEKELRGLLDKYKLEWGVIPTFPVYNILPEEVELAILIAKKYGVQYKAIYSDKKNENTK